MQGPGKDSLRILFALMKLNEVLGNSREVGHKSWSLIWRYVSYRLTVVTLDGYAISTQNSDFR